MFNPAKRCTAEEALDHDFLKAVRRKDMEVSTSSFTSYIFFFTLFNIISTLMIKQKVASQPLESPSFLEKSKVDLSIVKEEAYKEVLWYTNSNND